MSVGDGTWIDISAVGDAWEVDLNIAAPAHAGDRLKYRYRSACLGRVRTEFEPGRPPTGFYAK